VLINTIIPFSIVDGPGNRFVVFLQECNLNCLYCHNYETINKCINCGICVDYCPTNSIELVDAKMRFNQETCIDCDACIKACPYDSTPKAQVVDNNDLAQKILSYKDFIDGVTFSGGECMLQANAMLETIKILKENSINVLIDSNGTFAFDDNTELINLVDGFMLDIKTIEPKKSFELTGQEFDYLTLVYKLNQIGKLAELRTVDCHENESKNTIKWIKDFVLENTNVRIRINELATKPLKQERLEKLEAYIKDNT
jgi:pyruvate formate lyase activating enzyme